MSRTRRKDKYCLAICEDKGDAVLDFHFAPSLDIVKPNYFSSTEEAFVAAKTIPKIIEQYDVRIISVSPRIIVKPQRTVIVFAQPDKPQAKRERKPTAPAMPPVEPQAAQEDKPEKPKFIRDPNGEKNFTTDEWAYIHQGENVFNSRLDFVCYEKDFHAHLKAQTKKTKKEG